MDTGSGVVHTRCDKRSVHASLERQSTTFETSRQRRVAHATRERRNGNFGHDVDATGLRRVISDDLLEVSILEFDVQNNSTK